MPAVPAEVLGGGVYVVTQGTGPYSINETLAQNLSSQPWAGTVSPEIFSLGTLRGAPVVVRGVDPVAFLRIEGASSAPPPSLSAPWALAGSGLQARVGVSPGDELTLVGSSIPRLDVVPLAGVFRTSTAANDELLVDYGTARFLTGVGPGVYHSLRVRTDDPSALLAFLEARSASVHVTGPGGSVGSIGSAPLPADPRVINLFLRYGLGPLPGDYVAEGIAEASNSVQLVAWGLEVLVLLLVTFGLHAVQARAFADREATVGVLRALGASGGWMRRRAMRETLPPAAAAGLLGSVLGFATAFALPSGASIVAFGHTVRVTLDPLGLLLVTLVVVAVSALSELLLLQRAMAARPSESIRGTPPVGRPLSLEVVLRE